MRVKLGYLLLISSVFFSGCGNPKPQSSDFVGTWKSNDNAYITLKKNGTSVLKGADYFRISSFPHNKDKKLNAEGTWSFMHNTDSGIINGIHNGISIVYKIPEENLQGEIIFYISGRGIGGNSPPWSLFIWDGDPDEMNKYEFLKQ